MNSGTIFSLLLYLNSATGRERFFCVCVCAKKSAIQTKHDITPVFRKYYLTDNEELTFRVGKSTKCRCRSCPASSKEAPVDLPKTKHQLMTSLSIKWFIKSDPTKLLSYLQICFLIQHRALQNELGIPLFERIYATGGLSIFIDLYCRTPLTLESILPKSDLG